MCKCAVMFPQVSAGEKTDCKALPTCFILANKKRLKWWRAGSRNERTQWPSITLLRVDWSCLRIKQDELLMKSCLCAERWPWAIRQRRLRWGLRLFGLSMATSTILKCSCNTFSPLSEKRLSEYSCLTSSTPVGNLSSTAEGVSELDISLVLKPRRQISLPCDFWWQCPSWASWDTEESLLGFLSDDSLQ